MVMTSSMTNYKQRPMSARTKKLRNQVEAGNIHEQLLDGLQKAADLAKVNVLPLTQHDFTLHKSAFHGPLALQYGWIPSHLPSSVNVAKPSV